MPRGDLQVDRGRRRRGRRRTRPRRARRGWRRCRPSPGCRAACCSSAAAVMPIQPGRIAEEPTVPSPWSIGPGRPMPGADHGLARHAGVGQRLDHELGGHLEALVGVVVGVERAGALGEDRRREVGDRDAQVRVAEVDADGGAGAGVEARAGSAGGRPARRRREPGSGRSTTSPSACRSATRLETVERLSPVRRAMSAREIWPSSRSARITRRRLRRRSDSSEPARPGGMESVPLERSGGRSVNLSDGPTPRPG